MCLISWTLRSGSEQKVIPDFQKINTVSFRVLCEKAQFHSAFLVKVQVQYVFSEGHRVVSHDGKINLRIFFFARLS